MKRRGFLGGLLAGSIAAEVARTESNRLPTTSGRQLIIAGRLPPDPNVLVARGVREKDFLSGTIPKSLHLFLGVLSQDWTIALPSDIEDGAPLTVRIRKCGIRAIERVVVVFGAQTVLWVRAERDGCVGTLKMLVRV